MIHAKIQMRLYILRFVLLVGTGISLSWPMLCNAQVQPIDALVQIDLVMQSTGEHTRFVKRVMPNGDMTGHVTEGTRPTVPMRKPLRLTRVQINTVLEILTAWAEDDLLQVCPADAKGTDTLSVTIQFRERPPLAFTCTEALTRRSRKQDELLLELMAWVVVGF